ncbi:MAG: cytochrome C [Gammaproteobacteria bacterium]
MGKYYNKCHSCHTEDNWLQNKFKHNKTRFPLRGKHQETECVSCHAGDQYIKTPRDCYSCHKPNDVHQGRNGKQCQKCHSPYKWKKVSFDHDKKTKFPLRGKHDRISCQACHKQSPQKVKLKTSCISCHANDDRHKGRYGIKCQSCHNSTSWSKHFFNHDKKTKFKLRGKHREAQCADCHKGNLYKTKLKQDCYSCHQIDDKHKQQQGKQCQRCHNENSWRGKVRFDHDVTHFPLIGLHALVPCEECHLTSTYKNTKSDCNSCHSADDTHNQQLGTQCEDCHTPNGWGIWEFDHNKQSEFKINGAHKGLHCHSCHRSEVKRIAHNPRACSACHRNDDPHNGQFGSDCERCHTTKSFHDIKFR